MPGTFSKRMGRCSEQLTGMARVRSTSHGAAGRAVASMGASTSANMGSSTSASMGASTSANSGVSGVGRAILGGAVAVKGAVHLGLDLFHDADWWSEEQQR